MAQCNLAFKILFKFFLFQNLKAIHSNGFKRPLRSDLFKLYFRDNPLNSKTFVKSFQQQQKNALLKKRF